MSEKKTILIASYTSWYHALGISSYLAANHVTPDFSILIANEFFDKKRGLDDTSLRDRLGDFTLVKSYREVEQEVLRLPENIDIYVLSTSAFPYKLTAAVRKKSIPYKLVVIEEGIGSYSSVYSLFEAKLRESRLPLLKKILFSFSLFLKAIVKFFVFFKKKRCYWYNFNKSNLSINKEVVKAYKSELKSLSLSGKKSQSLENKLENCALLISSPFCELNLVCEKDFVKGVRDGMPKNKRLYVKPHPIEKVSKYNGAGFDTFSTDLPFEILMCDVDCSVSLFSFSSTCCYTSFLFFGKKIHRIKDVDAFYDKLSRRQKKIIDFVSI